MTRIVETRDQLLQQIEALQARLDQLDAEEAMRGAEFSPRPAQFKRSPARVATVSDPSWKHASEAQLRLLTEQMPAIVWTTDKHLRFTMGTGAGLRVLGLKSKELVGVSLYKHFQTDDADSLPIAQHRRALNGASASYEMPWQDRVFQAYIEPLRGHSGDVIGTIGVALDVTELKQTQASLVASEARFRALVENSYDVINMFAATGELVYTSPSIERVLGFRPEEMKQLPPSEVIHPDDFQRADQGFRSCLEQPGSVSQFTHRLRHKDGSFRTVEITGTNLLDEPGIHAMVSISRDITEQRQAEEALRESEERFKAIVANAPDAVFLVAADGDHPGTILMANEAAEHMHGYGPGELTGIPISSLDTPEAARQVPERLRRTAAGERLSFEVEHFRKDGTILPLEVTAACVRVNGRVCALAFDRDITERKRAEAAIHESGAKLQQLNVELEHRVQQRTAELSAAMARVEESERKLSAILDNTSFLIGLCNTDGVLLLVNRAVCTVLGHPESAWVGRPLWEGPAWPTDDVRAEIREAISRATSGEYCRAEVLHVLADGSTAIFDFSVSPIRDEDGHVVMLVPEGRDISALKRIEQELQERNAELQAFAYSVTHDLRAPVRAMEGFATALAEDYGKRLDEDGRVYIARIVRSAQRMDALIEDLLAYSQLARAELAVRDTSLRAVADEALEQLVRDITDSNAAIDVAKDLPLVRGHRATLVQVVANLVSNAVKFVARGVRPEVRIWSELRTDHQVRLWVADNGIGITAEDQNRIFGTFQRLHGIETYPGTGIGLAIVARGSSRMGGSCGVESEVGRGSRFWIELPMSGVLR